MTESRLRAVLFDLDGTLVDTLPDIAGAVNSALVELNLDPLPVERIGVFIGKGPRSLVSRVLDEQPTLTADARQARVQPLLDGYVRHYAPRIGRESHLFPGVREALGELSVAGVKLGVVTNALQHLGETVLARFDLLRFMDVVVGSDAVSPGKPAPGPLLRACRALDVTPADTLMVGDSENDVLAARAAGCAIVAVPCGYNAGAPPESLGCDIVENFTLLPGWVASYRRPAD
jgi:phosphoglycolate phosphatase